MPSVENATKGRTSYLKLVNDDGTVAWISFKTPLAAEEAAKAIELGLSDAEPITLAVFWDRYLEYHALPNLKPDSVRHYMTTYNSSIAAGLGDLSLSGLTSAVILEFRNRLAKAHGMKTATTALSVLSGILGVATRWQYIDANPIDTLDIEGLGHAPKG